MFSALLLSAAMLLTPTQTPPASTQIPAPVTAETVKKPSFHCTNRLARTLHKAGFRGADLREAWAIAMRESGGNPRAISATHDYGLFQINRAAHHRSKLWKDGKMLDRDYNAKVAAHFSNLGKNWSAWDISGTGQHLGNYTSRSVYEKYRDWWQKYPCAA